MGLDHYIRKRDLTATPEPGPEERPSTGSDPIFVVQRHDASHLHFDFRLEAGGVLKSWAVPKGPSMNPHDRRLAVMVEDHPRDYASFEGEIPEGNYGAGTVEIWDSGTYTPMEKHRDVMKAIDGGLLEFTLHGHKLRGLFSLVRTNMDGKTKNWLLLKKDDSYAVHRPYDAADIPSHEK